MDTKTRTVHAMDDRMTWHLELPGKVYSKKENLTLSLYVYLTTHLFSSALPFLSSCFDGDDEAAQKNFCNFLFFF